MYIYIHSPLLLHKLKCSLPLFLYVCIYIYVDFEMYIRMSSICVCVYIARCKCKAMCRLPAFHLRLFPFFLVFWCGKRHAPRTRECADICDYVPTNVCVYIDVYMCVHE